MPSVPKGGLLVRSIASGLCTGELMQWYMDQKIPHVLGHEVCGRVVDSQDERFPEGSLVAPHHHAPCLNCDFCKDGLYVHCAQWKATKLHPGGMAEYFAVSPENLNDTLLVDELRPVDAALIEPLACVVKSIRQARLGAYKNPRVAVIGLGFMGLLHVLVLPNAVGLELSEARRDIAKQLGLSALGPGSEVSFDVAFVCAGNSSAIASVLERLRPGGTVVMFSPLGPTDPFPVDLRQWYFNDWTLTNSFSCGPNDTVQAKEILEAGIVRAEQVVSDFMELGQLPEAYQKMKRYEMLKAMVTFDE